MTTEIVLSTIEYTGKDAANADFWKNCYHEDEVTPEMRMTGKQWYKYHVKFDGLKPIQITKSEKI
jgi:hypothetical protein